MKSHEYRLEQSLGYLVNRASRAIRRAFNARLVEEGFDVTGEQWAVLVHLWERDGRPQQELADILYKDKTTLTRLLNDLEKRNLVLRVPDQRDRRHNLVYLTPHGRAIEDPLKTLAQRVLNDAQAGLSDEQLDVARHVLRHLHDSLI